MSGMIAPGRLISSGRWADVYDVGGGRVLRRYRDAALAADREAEIMTHARAHGVPVPRVHDVSGAEIVMEYARGPTMLELLTRRPWLFRSQARLLAGLHDLVHAVPAPSGLRAPFGPGPVLLHTDLHPANVIITGDGPRLIDWQGAAQGPAAAADLAMTWVLLISSVIPGPPRQRAVGRVFQAVFARSFLAAAGPVAPRWLAAAADLRLADPTVLDAERARLRRLRHRISGQQEGAQQPGRR